MIIFIFILHFRPNLPPDICIKKNLKKKKKTLPIEQTKTYDFLLEH